VLAERATRTVPGVNPKNVWLDMALDMARAVTPAQLIDLEKKQRWLGNDPKM
jgi:hypothetical protein